jgi:alkaline phosphatase D
LLGVCAAIALLVAAPSASAAKGFKFGVAAGDVTSHSAILWARSSKPGPVVLRVGGKLYRLRATKSNDLTVQKKVAGLKPNKKYRYQFRRRGGRSQVGKFKTAPGANADKTIRFAWSGDQDAQPAKDKHKPYWNNFQVLSRMRSEKNDFNILMGDIIYSDSEVPCGCKRAITVPQKWHKYRQNLALKPFAALRTSGALYSHWDDHEFINDFARHESKQDLGIPIPTEKLYKNGVRAFQDYNPVTYTKKKGIYRTERWGKNLELFFLDERSFRSAKADSGGVCDNPQGSGNPDLAPTAPQTPTRDTFGAFPGLEQLQSPPPASCNTAINSPNRTMLGARQLAKFKQGVKSSTATFKVVMNEVPIQQFYALPYDRWEGYAHERLELLNYLRSNVDNVVFLTTDVHANMVNDARLRTLEPPSPQESGIMDITTGPIATKSFSREIDDIGGPGSGQLITQSFFKVPPATPPAFGGAGQTCSATDVFSYGEVSVTATELKIELKDITGGPVHEGANGGGATCPNNSTITIPAS